MLYIDTSMNVSITEKQKNYIDSQVKSGDYQNASELVRDALRLHQLYREKVLRDLQAAIEEGWSGKTSEKSVLDMVAEKQTKYGM